MLVLPLLLVVLVEVLVGLVLLALLLEVGHPGQRDTSCLPTAPRPTFPCVGDEPRRGGLLSPPLGSWQLLRSPKEKAEAGGATALGCLARWRGAGKEVGREELQPRSTPNSSVSCLQEEVGQEELPSWSTLPSSMSSLHTWRISQRSVSAARGMAGNLQTPSRRGWEDALVQSLLVTSMSQLAPFSKWGPRQGSNGTGTPQGAA